MGLYVAEEFTAEEADILRRYFTNLDGPVFALVNLPEVVKGALFARYSRSAKSLRRLFLDEFVGDLDISGDATIDATVGLRRAEELYDRVFFDYGDDSVAQLGGVHLACEQASNLLTKVLEWGRLASYLEQSTRYIAYDTRLGGRYRYYRDPDVLTSSLGTRYVGDMDRLFDTYAELVTRMSDFYRAAHPKQSTDSDFVHRQAIRAKAFDAVRGVLPAASLSSVGIYGSGAAFLGDTKDILADEDYGYDQNSPFLVRAESEQDTLKMSQKGIRSIVLRLPLFVYGRGGSSFVPFMIGQAKQMQSANYTGAGAEKVSAVHVEDVADLYVLALETSTAKGLYNVAAENVSMKDLNEAIGALLDVKANSISAEKAREQFGAMFGFLSINNQLSAEKARRELRWSPNSFTTILDDIENGSYRKFK